MRAGDSIGPYRLLRDFTTAGGGMSMWTLAERDGVTYFLKQFLSPKRPIPGGPGSEKTNARRRRECERFEQHHLQVMNRLRTRSVPGGNLVVTVDFFCADGIYYKVTEAVNVSSSTVRDVAKLPIDQRLLILKTVTHSVGILHAVELVHGDIKPDNVLIKRTATANFTSKLIDFDNCFISGHPPDPDETVGDIVFLSPELALHIAGVATPVATSSDIFALGILLTLYLTGGLPIIEGGEDGAPVHERIAAGGTPLAISPSSEVPRDVATIIEGMLRLDPSRRPTAPAILAALQGRGVHMPDGDDAPRLRGRLLDAGVVSTSAGLRGSLLSTRGLR